MIFLSFARKNINLSRQPKQLPNNHTLSPGKDNRTIMDSPSSALEQNIDLSKLSEKDKQELQQFIVNESQKARIQQC